MKQEATFLKMNNLGKVVENMEEVSILRTNHPFNFALKISKRILTLLSR